MSPELVISASARGVLPRLAAWGVRAKLPARLGALVAGPALPPGEWSIEHIATHPRIAVWRDAYRAMGLKPSEWRSSIEQLARRILRGDPPRIGVAAVDLYNSVASRWVVPMGGYDATALCDAPIEIRPLRDGDDFRPLGGSKAGPSSSGVLGYCQGGNCICWALNCRDDQRTALRPETRSALFTSEAVDDEGAVAALTALSDLSDLIRLGGGEASDIIEFSAT